MPRRDEKKIQMRAGHSYETGNYSKRIGCCHLMIRRRLLRDLKKAQIPEEVLNEPCNYSIWIETHRASCRTIYRTLTYNETHATVGNGNYR